MWWDRKQKYGFLDYLDRPKPISICLLYLLMVKVIHKDQTNGNSKK